jgi:hypothetical protein
MGEQRMQDRARVVIVLDHQNALPVIGSCRHCV